MHLSAAIAAGAAPTPHPAPSAEHLIIITHYLFPVSATHATASPTESNASVDDPCTHAVIPNLSIASVAPHCTTIHIHHVHMCTLVEGFFVKSPGHGHSAVVQSAPSSSLPLTVGVAFVWRCGYNSVVMQVCRSREGGGCIISR